MCGVPLQTLRLYNSMDPKNGAVIACIVRQQRLESRIALAAGVEPHVTHELVVVFGHVELLDGRTRGGCRHCKRGASTGIVSPVRHTPDLSI